MKLYKIEASNCATFFGTPENPIAREVTIIAQTPSFDAFLLLFWCSLNLLSTSVVIPVYKLLFRHSII